MVLVGGYLVDRIGARKAIFLFGTICLTGAIVTVLSGHLPVMAAGRLIFGIGAESLIVAVTTAIAKWFRGKELSFAFGINLMIARAGTLLAQTSPTWARSRLRQLAHAIVDLGWLRHLLRDRGADLLGDGGHTRKRTTNSAMPERPIRWCSTISSISGSLSGISSRCVWSFIRRSFPLRPSPTNSSWMRMAQRVEVGGMLVGSLTFATMFGTPLLGLLVDKIGKRALLMMIGSVLLVPVYLIMAYTHTQASLYLPMAMMGIAFSLIPAVIWPSVAYIVDQNKLGTAYGLMTAIQNIGFFGFNHRHRLEPTTIATPAPPIPPATISACGSSPFWACWECSSPSCCGNGSWARTGMAWRPSPPVEVIDLALRMMPWTARLARMSLGFTVAFGGIALSLFPPGAHPISLDFLSGWSR